MMKGLEKSSPFIKLIFFTFLILFSSGMVHADITLPFHNIWYDHFGQIMLKGNIGGEEYSFIVDTGAQYSIIRKTATVERHLKNFQMSGTDEHGYQQYILDTFYLSDLKVEDVVFSVGQDNNSKYIPSTGIIGVDFLSKFSVVIDYQHKTISFHDSSILGENNPSFSVINLTPILETNNGRWYIDTGQGQLYAALYNYTDSASMTQVLGRKHWAGWYFEDINDYSIKWLENISFGSLQIEELPVHTVKIRNEYKALKTRVLNLRGVIDSSFLRDRKLILDFFSNRYQVYGDGTHSMLENINDIFIYGITLERNIVLNEETEKYEEKWSVSALIKDGYFFNLGIRVGDVIKNGATHKELFNQSRQSFSPISNTLQVERNGNDFTVQYEIVPMVK